MGWTALHKDSNVSIKSFFENEFTPNEVVGCKVVNKTAYIALKLADKTEVVGVVVLLDYKPKLHFNFAYKVMDETMIPYYYDCPESIMNMLTETDNESAIQWRAFCKETTVKTKALKSLKVGDTIVFQNEFSFKKYGKAKTFTLTDKKKLYFNAKEIGIEVKLRKGSLTSNNLWVKSN